MINFDPTKVSFEIVQLKAVTTALGGSISIIDPTNPYNKHKRIKCPLSVARAFIKKNNKNTKYIIPVYTCVTKYDDMIVCLEAHPMGTFGSLTHVNSAGETVNWSPNSETNFDSFVAPLMGKPNRTWYFDGRYIYCFTKNDVDVVIGESTFMSNDGSFRKIATMGIDTQKLYDVEQISPSNRHCVAYVASTGDYSISPPIWKNLDSIGGTRVDANNDNSDDDIKFDFDTIDNTMSINLNFALACGKVIGSIFGYEKIEPLNLPSLMVDLGSVNLLDIDQSVKATYDIGLKFSHCLAWLLGLLGRTDTLESYIAMRSIIKYLTKRGIFRKDLFKMDNVFLDGMSFDSISVLKESDINMKKQISRISTGELLLKAKHKTTEHQSTLAGLSS